MIPKWPAVIIASVIVLLSFMTIVLARDLDGRYADSELHGWFNMLSSGKGLCCSVADGVTLKDVDWDTKDDHYRVRLYGKWIDVPESALVTVPNKFGTAVAWPMTDDNGNVTLRCFMPGTLG